MSKTKQKNKKSNLLSNLLFGMIFLAGLLILLYPKISDWYYRMESEAVNQYFDEAKSELSREELERRMELARSYNLSLQNVVTHDPYEKEKVVEGRREYARMLELKEYLGHVEIPKIGQDIPLFAGTTEYVLQKGAGHLEGTSLPIGGESTHTVITAHTGLPKMKLLTDLKQVEIGDVFYVHNIAEVLAYQVDQIKVVEPSDFSELLVVEGQDYATLLTCTPYMVNTHRLLVRGHRIPFTEEVKELTIEQGFKIEWWMIAIPILVLVFLLILFVKRKRKKNGA